MKKISVLTLFVVCSSLFLTAQPVTDRPHDPLLTFELGASVNYYYGMASRNFGKFENDRVNWQLNGMLGFTLASDKADRRTMIAAFGSLGFNNEQTVSNTLSDQEYTTAATGQAGVNNFYSVEGGIIIADMIRISTGTGQQNFNTQALVSQSGGLNLSTTNLRYNSSTVGVRLKIGVATWTIDCNFEYGQDFNRTVIVPSTGLMFRF